MTKRVAIVACDNYRADTVNSAIAQLLTLLPGWEAPFASSNQVLLKPNLLMRRLPEEATTTHPEVVRQMAIRMQTMGKSCLLADSPGGPFSETLLSRVYEGCGMTKLAREGLLRLNSNVKHCEIEVANGLILKRMTIAAFAASGMPMLNICKLKTHMMMTFTGAVKNIFGIVPGALKAEYHFRMPGEDDFADALIDICLAGQPKFNVMDAIVAMEGAGPSSGNPRETKLLLASLDPFALDLVATHLIGLAPAAVPTVRRSIARGLSPDNVDEVELVGLKLDQACINDFAIPITKGPSFLGGRAKRIADAAIRPLPVFNFKICTGCGICARHCPAKVIEMRQGRPHLKLAGCIRCFCCHELCPSKAVDIKRKPLMRLLSKL
jgi:uncharacterized protein (DUF362 family)/Pyruvate/2-oxoacid:ferredoxin oxidoreductase delta subunit